MIIIGFVRKFSAEEKKKGENSRKMQQITKMEL